jgi:hypothetical protein
VNDNQQQTKPNRTEDGIIALSYDRYMATLNPEWVVRLPMVKAAVRYVIMIWSLLHSNDCGLIFGY